MNPRSIALVRDSWSAITPRRKEVCSEFYQRLFAAYPEVKPLFGGDMQRQTRLFVTMIDTVVSCLDDPEPVRPLLQTLGARHADYGVTAADYVKFETVLLDTLEQALGGAFTGETRAAWCQIYERLADTMQEGTGQGWR